MTSQRYIGALEVPLVTVAHNDDTDRDAIADIDQACFGQPTVNLSAELERPWARVWVARPGGEQERPAALLLAWSVADELHILSIATLPQHRRTGLARALLSHALDFAKRQRAQRVQLEVRRSNRAAIALYRTFGFSATGIREQYYADNLEDAIEMALFLDPFTGLVVPSQDEVHVDDE
ncbi:MAG TPA: GNAT family N-acetyltransferase [Polyangiaceae bacterium]